MWYLLRLLLCFRFARSHGSLKNMELKKIFSYIGSNKLDIKGLSDDSRLVKDGDAFFVRERKQFDIFSVISEVARKASVVVAEKKNRAKIVPLVRGKPLILVENIQKEFHRAIDIFFGIDNHNFKFIGVTGTNGKTTTTDFIYRFLKYKKEKASLIGTVKYYVGKQIYNADFTTPDYLTLKKMLSQSCVKRGFVVMEVSSHGIEQGRVEGIDFSSTVFTNLTRDHLDYHGTFAHYFNVKKSFFLNNKRAMACVNVDDRYGKRLLNDVRKSMSYGKSLGADIFATRVILSYDGTVFDLSYGKKTYNVKTPLVGEHNIYNIMAAAGSLLSLGFSFDEIVSFVPFFYGVPGRLEKVVPDVFVDYAHTPDALERVLYALRNIGYKKIICVFGCGGDRDKGKRKTMGAIADRLADFSFITSDNPRSEDPWEICRHIEKGFLRKNYRIDINREKAIYAGLTLQRRYRKSCLLVAGKGHEDYQIIGTKKLHFSDSEIICKALQRG